MVKPLSSRNNRVPVVVVDIYKKKSGLLKVSLLLLLVVKYAGTSFAFKYLWGSVYKLGKGEKKNRRKEEKEEKGKEEKEKRRKVEKKKRGKEEKRKRRKGKNGKGEKGKREKGEREKGEKQKRGIA